MHHNNVNIKGKAMLKHMLCGIVVMTAGCVIGSDEKKASQEQLEEAVPNVSTASYLRPVYLMTVFPGRTCTGIDVWWPADPNDQNIPSWKHLGNYNQKGGRSSRYE
jgi:hypothetical protein